MVGSLDQAPLSSSFLWTASSHCFSQQGLCYLQSKSSWYPKLFKIPNDKWFCITESESSIFPLKNRFFKELPPTFELYFLLIRWGFSKQWKPMTTWGSYSEWLKAVLFSLVQVLNIARWNLKKNMFFLTTINFVFCFLSKNQVLTN